MSRIIESKLSDAQITAAYLDVDVSSPIVACIQSQDDWGGTTEQRIADAQYQATALAALEEMQGMAGALMSMRIHHSFIGKERTVVCQCSACEKNVAALHRYDKLKAELEQGC